MFDGFATALKPGGLVLLEGYRREQLNYATGGPSSMENLYTEHMLREHFCDWHIESLANYDAPIKEGTGNSGMSALIDLVARKRRETASKGRVR
jgi:hypothetical protein